MTKMLENVLVRAVLMHEGSVKQIPLTINQPMARSLCQTKSLALLGKITKSPPTGKQHSSMATPDMMEPQRVFFVVYDY